MPDATARSAVPRRLTGTEIRGLELDEVRKQHPLIDQFTAAMAGRDHSPNTLRRRRGTLTRFAESLDGKALLEATPVDVEDWALSQTVTATSRGLYLKDLRAFYRWCARRDLVAVNPCDKIDMPKRRSYLPHPISEVDLARALAAAQHDHALYTVLVLGAYAGLRREEIARIQGENIDRQRALLRILGKGSKERLVPMHPRVVEALAGAPARGQVLYNHDGRPLTAQAVGFWVKKHLAALGIDHTTHSLRHRFGTRAYAACRDLVAVQELMGHADPSTTRVYVQFDPKTAREAVLGLDDEGDE